MPKIGAALIAILMVVAARTAQAPQYQKQWLRLDFVAGLTLANSFHQKAAFLPLVPSVRAGRLRPHPSIRTLC
jgi:hypothetical protein